MDKRGVAATIIFLAAIILIYFLFFSGADNKDDKEEEDEFIKEYLRQQKEKDNKKVVVVNKEETQEIGEPKKKATTSTTTTTLKTKSLKLCDRQCCEHPDYEQKNCSIWFACINFTCVDRPCPHECCVLGMYEGKNCMENIECINYTCIKPSCPSEFQCCNQKYYNGGTCNKGYECINNMCYPKDSDGDGLVDVIEKNYGTDPKKYDTDSDKLNDHYEIKILGTDPLNSNTDNDRYKDGVDEKANETESAQISILVTDFEVVINQTLLHSLLMYLDFNQQKPENDTLLALYSANIRFENNGTDYTDSLNYTYKMIYVCDATPNLLRKPFIRKYIKPGTNLEGNDSASWYDERGALNQTEGEIIWTLKEKQYHKTNRFKTNIRYVERFVTEIRFWEINNKTYNALVALNGCRYNFTVSDIEYESYTRESL